MRSRLILMDNFLVWCARCVCVWCCYCYCYSCAYPTCIPRSVYNVFLYSRYDKGLSIHSHCMWVYECVTECIANHIEKGDMEEQASAQDQDLHRFYRHRRKHLVRKKRQIYINDTLILQLLLSNEQAFICMKMHPKNKINWRRPISLELHFFFLLPPSSLCVSYFILFYFFGLGESLACTQRFNRHVILWHL